MKEGGVEVSEVEVAIEIVKDWVLCELILYIIVGFELSGAEVAIQYIQPIPLPKIYLHFTIAFSVF